MAQSNFPTPPGRYNKDSSSFPNDLVQGTREFYTAISFMEYNYSLAMGGAIQFNGDIKLPMPKKINDNEVIIWEEWSGLQTGAGVLSNALQYGGSLLGRPNIGQFIGGAVSATAGAVQMSGTFTGQTVNPFQFMMFKRPNFKEHVLQWQLAPNTQQESDSLKKIINKCKKAALPSAGEKSGLMKYPEIAMVSFKPNKYLFKLKPCAIVSVQVDYSGAGMPSFFKSGAPTIVNLTLQLKELELWSKDNYQE